MVAGVITALVVVFSQVFYFQAPAYAKKDVKTGHEKKEKQNIKYGSNKLPILKFLLFN